MQSLPSEMKFKEVQLPDSGWCFRIVDPGERVCLRFPDGRLSSPFYQGVKRTICKKRKEPPRSVLAPEKKAKIDQVPSKGKCPWPGCDHFEKHNNLRKHYRKHTDERPYACDFEGCSNKFRENADLVKHKRRHTGEKPFKCDIEGCNKMFSTRSSLVVHTRRHAGERPFICSVAGCNKRFTESGHLLTHTRRHANEKSFACDFDGCDKRFVRRADLVGHTRVHTGDKPFICGVDGCTHRTAHRSSLVVHKRIHTDERPLKCNFIGCTYQARRRHHLAAHECTHSGDKPFACALEGCDFRSAQQSHAKSHFKSMHTPEGQARQKKKEHRMFLALTKREVVITDDDKQRHIDFSCIGGTRAFLDFAVYKEDRNVIVECMENAHDYLPVQCDPIRASKIFEAMAVAGNTLPVEFHFVNPDPFTVDGKPWKRKYETRMDMVAESIHAPAIEGIKPLSLVYWFYPIERGYPKVMWDKDYPKELRECVRCVN